MIQRDFVGDENLPRDDFRQRSRRRDADLLAAQLSHAGQGGRGNQIEGRLIRECEDDPDIGAVDRGANCGAGGGAKIDAAGEHRLDGLNRLHENKLRFQTLFAKEAAVAGDDERHVEGAARDIGDAQGDELGGLFGGVESIVRD